MKPKSFTRKQRCSRRQTLSEYNMQAEVKLMWLTDTDLVTRIRDHCMLAPATPHCWTRHRARRRLHKIPADQLDSLVAPIALYPDNLLSQTLVASTYPLEIIQLQQWLEKNPNLAKDQNETSGSGQETALGSEHSGDGALCLMSSNSSPMTFSGPPIWATPFWRSRVT